VQLTSELPNLDKFRKKALIAIRIGEEFISQDNVARDILFIEMTRNVLEHLYSVFNEIMSPVMQNPQNQEGWTDLVSKDLM
jgi:dynein heavy chain, axonemal